MENLQTLIEELEGWKAGEASSDDTRRMIWLMVKAAAALRRTQSEGAVRTEGVDGRWHGTDFLCEDNTLIARVVRLDIDGKEWHFNNRITGVSGTRTTREDARQAALASLPQHAQSGVAEAEKKFIEHVRSFYSGEMDDRTFAGCIGTALDELDRALATPSIPAPVAESELQEAHIDALASKLCDTFGSQMNTPEWSMWRPIARFALAAMSRLATVPSMQTEKGNG